MILTGKTFIKFLKTDFQPYLTYDISYDRNLDTKKPVTFSILPRTCLEEPGKNLYLLRISMIQKFGQQQIHI
jgi:hypothetical protein